LLKKFNADLGKIVTKRRLELTQVCFEESSKKKLKMKILYE